MNRGSHRPLHLGRYGVIVGLCLALLPLTGHATPAPTTWSVSGPLRQVTSPREFSTPGAHLIPISFRVLARIESPRYYVVNGTPVNGHYAYAFSLTRAASIRVVASELGVDLQAHTELFVIGQLRTHAGQPGEIAESLPLAKKDITTTWKSSGLGGAQVATVCDYEQYNYDSGTNTISNLSPSDCGSSYKSDLLWYQVGNKLYGHYLNYNGTSSAVAAVYTAISFGYPLLGNISQTDYSQEDCQIDFNSNEETGNAHGSIIDDLYTEIWSPNGKANCSYDYYETND